MDEEENIQYVIGYVRTYINNRLLSKDITLERNKSWDGVTVSYKGKPVGEPFYASLSAFVRGFIEGINQNS